MKLGVLLPAALLACSGFGSGRIAGTVDFKGRTLKPQTVKSVEPGCKGALVPWEPRALVRISRGAGAGVAPSTAVVLEEKGCTFRPWLQGAVRGQKILLRNADGTTHSVRAAAGQTTLFHVIQPPRAQDLQKDLLASDVVKVSCDLHPWMTAFVVVSAHSYFAVTADDGTYEIKDVPPGAYAVEAWNDRLGVLRAEVVVEEGQTVDPKFTFTVR